MNVDTRRLNSGGSCLELLEGQAETMIDADIPPLQLTEEFVVVVARQAVRRSPPRPCPSPAATCPARPDRDRSGRRGRSPAGPMAGDIESTSAIVCSADLDVIAEGCEQLQRLIAGSRASRR